MSIDFKLHRRAQDCIGQSYLTNSKRAESHILGVYPTHAVRSFESFIWDSENNKYLDFICGLGTNIIGYGNIKIAHKLREYLQFGFSPSLATPFEVEAAEKLKELFPYVDAVKWLKTGTEACMAAIKIARATTGRKLVYSAGYHGWSDAFVSLTPPGVGVCKSQDMRILGPNQLPSEYPDEIAAVIVEPIITDHSKERIDYLTKLRDYCTRYGVMLIFDEIITGFRYPKYSASRFYNITPDLICLGKAIANGLPLACVAGNYSVMNGDYFVSSTYAGEILSLIAAKETMRILQTEESLDELWNDGQYFLDWFNSIWPEAIRIEGYPTRGVFVGDPMVKALFFQASCEAGILFGPSWFFNFGLSREVEAIKGTLKEILEKIKRGEISLKGDMPKSPFSQEVRK